MPDAALVIRTLGALRIILFRDRVIMSSAGRI